MEQINQFYLIESQNPVTFPVNNDFDINNYNNIIRVIPHYKKIELKYKKHTNQMFFRNSIDGKITLFNGGYNFVYNSSLESYLYFIIVKNDKIISKNIFNKTDCKFDYTKCSVELKLSPEDKYTQILNKYDSTYDLIKLAPHITPLTVTKRMAYQFYISGANNVTVVEGSGVYYEADVNEPINNDTELVRKYHFHRIDVRKEIHLDGFNYGINGTYIVDKNSDSWINTIQEYPGSFIRFEKEYSVGETYEGIVRCISNGAIAESENIFEIASYLKVDLYSINIYTGLPDENTGTPTKIYKSQSIFYKDKNDFEIGSSYDSDNKAYYFLSIEQPVPMLIPSPDSFYLDDNIIGYGIYCRLICDKERVEYGGTIYNLHDIPVDDFCFNRANYKYCIGANPGVTIVQKEATSYKPTRYGVNDHGKYFDIKELGQVFSIKPVPISRSSWANTSIWAIFTSDFYNIVSAFSYEFILKDAYDIADVISAMLSKISPSILHAGVPEYSSFLYSPNSPLTSDTRRNNCRIYISPKSNVLKSNYDQAAQKAEITFEKLMNMLRDCFRCYWFIDKQNRFRIEHISYFLNGGSYNPMQVQYNLINELDKFNKKNILYCQQEIEYDKSDLSSRYEFKWMDDCTDEFGNNSIDIKSKYIQQDKVENINAGDFSSDIDLMMCAPDKFSSDGFALIIADANTKKVPIIDIYDFYDGDCIYGANLQNYLASWLYLIRYYMYDMPAYNISLTNISYSSQYSVKNIKRSKKHNIEFSENQFQINVNSGLVKTEIGNGYVEEKSANIDTGLVKIELRYNPG